VIVYRLACDAPHEFEGWFASSESCEQQALAGQIRCPVCDSHAIRKLPTAPYVQTSGASASATAPVDEAKLRAMVRAEAAALVRKHIVENIEDVGREFPAVARRIHYREEEARNIRGRATASEAEELRDEGIETFTVSAEVLPPESDVH
jgi:hypothetical protein